MQKLLIVLLFIGFIPLVERVVLAQRTTPPIPSHTDTIKKEIYKEFALTYLKSRIVKVEIKKRKKETKVHLTWHPRKVKDIAKDTFVIVKIINKIIPDYDSISLQAIEPNSLRWTKRVFWDAVITRKDLLFINNETNTGSDEPRPLFY